MSNTFDPTPTQAIINFSNAVVEAIEQYTKEGGTVNHLYVMLGYFQASAMDDIKSEAAERREEMLDKLEEAAEERSKNGDL